MRLINWQSNGPQGAAYSPSEIDVGNCTGTKTIDLSTGWVFYITLTGNCTFTLTNPVAGGRYLFHVACTGAFSPTFPTTFRYPGSVTPTWVATNGKKDIVGAVYSGKESLYDAAVNPAYATT